MAPTICSAASQPASLTSLLTPCRSHLCMACTALTRCSPWLPSWPPLWVQPPNTQTVKRFQVQHQSSCRIFVLEGALCHQLIRKEGGLKSGLRRGDEPSHKLPLHPTTPPPVHAQVSPAVLGSLLAALGSSPRARDEDEEYMANLSAEQPLNELVLRR